MQPKTTQASVAVDADGQWIVGTRWQELGVTHWHLNTQEWRKSDSMRFEESEKANAARRSAADGVAWSPLEVSTWHVAMHHKLLEQYSSALDDDAREAMFRSAGLTEEEDWQRKKEVTLWMAALGKDVWGLCSISEERIVHLHASASASTSCHQELSR